MAINTSWKQEKSDLDHSAREGTYCLVPVLDEQCIPVQHQLNFLAAPSGHHLQNDYKKNAVIFHGNTLL